MNPTHLLLPSLLVLIGLGCNEGSSASSTEDEDPGPPDIILILADDLGYGDWEPTGGPMRTPNLMRLCAEGVRLDRYYTYPLCTPTRVSLMGGLSPMRFDMAFSPLRRYERRSLPREVETLPQRLHQVGYQTALVGKWHLGHMEPWMLPNQRGFDHFYGFLTGSIQYFSHMSGPVGRDWQRNGESLDEKGYSTTLFGEEAARWIDQQDVERPLFLYLPFNAPHVPLMAPKEYVSRYQVEVPDLGRRKFCGMVTAMDDAIGMVLDAVERRGRADRTLVIFLSDNGAFMRESGSNGPLRGNKGSTYEGAIRVPGVVRWPGHLPTGLVSPELVNVLDWMPSILQAAGIENLDGLDGRDVLARLAATTEQSVTETREDLFFTACTTSHVSYSVIRWPWKCVVRIRKANGKVSTQLFRVDEDPFEEKNLRSKQPDLTEELAQVLRDWMAEQLPGEDFLAPSDCFDKAWPQDWVEPEDWTRPLGGEG